MNTMSSSAAPASRSSSEAEFGRRLAPILNVFEGWEDLCRAMHGILDRPVAQHGADDGLSQEVRARLAQVSEAVGVLRGLGQEVFGEQVKSPGVRAPVECPGCASRRVVTSLQIRCFGCRGEFYSDVQQHGRESGCIHAAAGAEADHIAT